MQVNDTYRPVYHASVPKAWSNDPNGLIYYKGRAHLFFQYYPYKAQWGPMHWGHFTTEDFIKWEMHPIALAPDREYEEICGCCSGNSFVKDDRLWLIYTAAQPELQRQCLAYSDDGIHFHKVEDNPVLTSDMLSEEVSPRDFRDPKIIRRGEWYYCLAGIRIIDPVLFKKRQERLKQKEQEQKQENAAKVQWSPSLTVNDDSVPSSQVEEDKEALGYGNMLLCRTRDLKNWEYAGKLFEKQEGFSDEFFTLDGVYECPDYFTCDGTEILLASPQNLPQMGHRFQNLHSCIYMTGHLNMDTGHFEINSIEDLDSGFDIYASQVLKMPDGRHILIAWKEMWDRQYPTQQDKWVGTYTLPRELHYRDGHLYQSPVREIKKYRANKEETGQIPLCNASVSVKGFSGKTIEIKASFRIGGAARTGVKLFKGKEHETLVYYDAGKSAVVFDRTRSGVELKTEGDTLRYCDIDGESVLRLHIFLDVSSVEVFINDGRYTMTCNVYPDPEDTGVEFFCEEGNALLQEAVKYDIIL